VQKLCNFEPDLCKKYPICAKKRYFLPFLYFALDKRKSPEIQGFEVVARVGFEPTTRGL
jgi:hypothetical protein